MPALSCISNYHLIKSIGHGAYGMVWAANDNTINESDRNPQGEVALKQVTAAFQQIVSAKRLLREILLMKHLNHPNIVHLRDLLLAHDENRSLSLYIVTERMDTDLHKIIRSPQHLSEEHVKFLLYQILCGVGYLHAAGVIHRDIKPSNILVNENCEVRVCDLGLARAIGVDEDSDEKIDMTVYVVTRHYRAPELLMQEQRYTTAIDVWSVGCILAEMLKRKPLFPGRDYIHQLVYITNTLGTPNPNEFEHIGKEAARNFLSQLAPSPGTPFETLFPTSSPVVIDLLRSMLCFSPNTRLTIEGALKHPFLSSYHVPTVEPPQKFTYKYANQPLTKNEMRDIILDQVREFHPECEDLITEAKQIKLSTAVPVPEEVEEEEEVEGNNPEDSESSNSPSG